MEKNTNIDQQSVSKAVAHDAESADVIFATAYQEPPPLFRVADPAQSKKVVDNEEEAAEKEAKAEVSPQAEPVQSAVDNSSDAGNVLAPIVQKAEEPEEELVESPDIELVFADAPSDEGDEEGNAEDGGSMGGASGEDNPVQNKCDANSSPAIQLKKAGEEEEESLQLKKVEEEEESLQLKKVEEDEESLQMKKVDEEEEQLQLKKEDEEEEGLQMKKVEEEEESLQLKKEEEEEERLQLKSNEIAIQRDSNLDLLEAGGHPNRNQHNQFPTGRLAPVDGSSNPTFEYIEGSNTFIDEAGRVWTMLADEENVYHQPPEVVDGFLDNQAQKFSHWWNGTERAPFPNKKFLSSDGDTGGSFEAILQPNEDGTYSTNWLNSGPQQGTYNFYSPEGFGGNAGHLFFDILPHFANDDYDITPTQNKTDKQGTDAAPSNSSQLQSLSPAFDMMGMMEASFGTSFSDVNIHKDSAEATKNGALAFAKGKDIHFAPGQFNVNTKEGLQLIGHELAHVVQQKQGRVKANNILRNGTKVNDDPALEKEADDLGVKAADFSLSADSMPSVPSAPFQLSSSTIQRQAAPAPADLEPEGPPEPGLDGFSAEELAQAEAELNSDSGPETPFKKIVEEPKPQKKVKKKAPKPAVPKEKKVAKKKATKKSGASEAYSPPASSISAEGLSTKAYLMRASQPVLDDGKKKARGLETNERRNEGAMVKTSNAKKAVTAPPGETQSRKDGDQARETDGKPEPEVRKDQAKSDFEKGLADSLPTKIKDVEKFKGSSKAREITDKAKKVIAEDKDSTTDTYIPIVRTEFSLTNPGDNPVPLGPIETPEITAPFNIANKVVPDLKPLKANFEGSTEEIEAKMAEQGATAENMALAKSAKLDTFKSNKDEFTTLESNLDSALEGIYQEGSQKTEGDFLEAEEKSRKEMREERENQLNEAKGNQETATSDLEKKRLEIVKNIHAIYDPVEKKVNERLAKLDETTRIEFENGMNEATKEFENNVDTRFKAFKKERYSGFWGPAKWLKDKILGVNSLQEVKDILSSEKENYEENIDELIEDITGRNTQVIELCKQEINEAKVKIDEYIDSLPDALKQIAYDASKEIKDKLIALEDSVKEKEKELENTMTELRQEAMDWVEAKIEEYNEKWGGFLDEILGFLGDLAMAILEGLLEAAGVEDPGMIIDMVKQAASAIISIIKDPIGFFSNLVTIVKDGFTEFFSGGLKNLFSAFLEWLTGSDGTIVFPTEWTLKNILLMLLDFFGIGWESIKGYFAEELGPSVVNFTVGAVQLIQLVMERGPIAIFELLKDSSDEIVGGGWNMIKEKYGERIGETNIQLIEMFADLLQKVAQDGLAGIWDFIKEKSAMVLDIIKGLIVDAIIDYAKVKVITAGIKALIKLASGVIGWIVAAYDTVMAFIKSYSTIAALIGAILKSAMHAANDAIAAGVALIMDAIKLIIAAILTFIAEFLGLGDIPGAVQGAIADLIGAVQKAIKDIIKWICDKLKMLWEKVKNFFMDLFGMGGDEEEEGEEEAEGETDLSHSVDPLNGKGMDSKGGGFSFSWGSGGGDYDFGGSPYGGGENARSVELQKGEMMGAEEDPEFQAEMEQLTAKAEEQKEHETTDQKVTETVEAAESPSNEVDSKAKSKQVDKMGEADADDFDAASFKRKLLDKIDAMAPDSMEKTMDFKGSGKAAELKATIATDVKDAGEETKKDIEETADQKPDTSGLTKKEHIPLPPDPSSPDRGAIAKEKAAPKTQPDEVFVAPIEEEKAALEQQYTDAEITDEQLTAANEPTFTAALDTKTTAFTTMETSVEDMRTGEQEVIGKAQGEAQTEGDEKLDAFLATNQQEIGNVSSQQKDSKSKDEAERQKVADQLESIYAETKSQVEAKLSGIESNVMSMYESAANSAKANFENHVDSSMKAYKEARYTGINKALWVTDKIFGLPSEVKIFYTQARDGYVAEMDAAMVGIADYVAGELSAAKQLIASGKDDINKYVNNLDPNLQKYAKEAAANIAAKFTALEETVAAKQTELIDNLAQKYTDSLGEIDMKIDEMMASNQGIIQSAVDSITGVIETINNMRNMLTSVITDGLAVINEILKHPIQFLTNLIQGVTAGFNQFASNITGHLQDGLSGWLFGTLGEAGIEIPTSFDLGGILSIITQVVGLTWNYIRARIVNFIGEDNMARLETTVEMFQAFRRDGVQGFKEAAAEEGAEMKETVIGEIKQFVIQEVVQKGIVWILSLFNPASAFVKACMAIYDIVMFFVNRGAQIAELVQSVLGAISAVVAGNVSAMAGAIEGTLARALPLAIGFMANLLGLGGLATKVKNIIKKAQAPVNKVVDKVVGRAKNLAGKFTDKDDDTDTENEEGEKDEAWDKGIASLTKIQTAAKNKGKTETEMDNALRGIKSTHGFDRLTKSADGEYWEVKAKKGDKSQTLDIKADFEGKEQEETAADPEVEAKAQEGFAELRAKSAKFDGDGASKDEADKIARDVKGKHPVFKELYVVDGEEDWDYKASYNPEVIVDGPDKEDGETIFPEHHFTVNEDSMTVAVADDKENVYVNNNSDGIRDFLNVLKQTLPNKLDKIKQTENYIDNHAEPIVKQLEDKTLEQAPLLQQLLQEMVQISELVRKLVGTDELELTEAKDKYLLEGTAGTYASMPKPVRDDLTADHMPQAELFKLLSETEEFASNHDMQKRASGTHANHAYAVNIQDKRHKAGRTWGSKGSATVGAFVAKYSSRIQAIDGNDEILDKNKAKREIAVDLLLEELVLDVAAMQTVYSSNKDSKVWDDLDEFVSPENKEELKNEIVNRVRSGLQLVRNQPMNSLKT